MEKFYWKDEYSLGVEKVDRQHQHLFELLINSSNGPLHPQI